MRKLLSVILVFCLPHSAFALKILSIKQDKVLLDLESENLPIGTKIGLRDSAKKPKGILAITKIQNGKAIASLKGEAQKDFSLEVIRSEKSEALPLSNDSNSKKSPQNPQEKSNLSKTEAKKSKTQGRSLSDFYGVTAGYSLNSMTVKPSSSSSIKLSGSSFNLSGFYQRKLTSDLGVRIFGSYQTLKASGTSQAPTCASGYNCSVDISYLGIESLVQYTFWKNPQYDIWAGAGLGLLFAISKNSNIIDTSKITTNQAILASVGLNYKLNRKAFIPLQLDYALYPDNQTTSANQIIFRAGYGLSF